MNKCIICNKKLLGNPLDWCYSDYNGIKECDQCACENSEHHKRLINIIEENKK